jgi:putative transposase
LFQGRFGCVAMDETHCLNAVRYLAFNPVRARLSATPGDWPWSSARAHLSGRDDALVSVRPRLELRRTLGALAGRSFASRSANGRPLATRSSSLSFERKLGRTVRRGKPGPKPRHDSR